MRNNTSNESHWNDDANSIRFVQFFRYNLWSLTLVAWTLYIEPTVAHNVHTFCKLLYTSIHMLYDGEHVSVCMCMCLPLLSIWLCTIQHFLLMCVFIQFHSVHYRLTWHWFFKNVRELFACIMRDERLRVYVYRLLKWNPTETSLPIVG